MQPSLPTLEEAILKSSMAGDLDKICSSMRALSDLVGHSRLPVPFASHLLQVTQLGNRIACKPEQPED